MLQIGGRCANAGSRAILSDPAHHDYRTAVPLAAGTGMDTVVRLYAD